jgi:isocitrate dehydrogenase (NAD+)
LIPGDGIGPEVTLAARRCIEATGADIDWEVLAAGEDVIASRGSPLPEEVMTAIKSRGVALKGPIITPIAEGFRSVNVRLRKKLDLYACLRPCKLYPGVRSNYQNVDIVVLRENTEDVYSGIEFDINQKATAAIIKQIEALLAVKIRNDSAISIKPISQSASERIIRFAFEYALKNGRRKITAVHKANIMKYSDGLFLKVFKKVASEYSGKIAAEDRLVDNMCMQLVQRPQDFDCLVLPNLYGDIISDLCAGLVGGLGVTPGANIGEGIAVFEATHGSAPKYKGMNKVNPTAMILSGVLMLRHLGESKAAQRLENAVAATIKEGEAVTYDLKKDRNDPAAVGTKEMTAAIIDKLKDTGR